MQLSRYIAHAGVCSRRKAEHLIASGAVLVNGASVLQWAYKVGPTDKVEYQGREIKPEESVYLVLNKPTGVVTTVAEKGSQTVLELVDFEKRVYPVGRLESAATGVLLLTNDGALTQRLVHARDSIASMERCYRVTLIRRLDRRTQQTMMDGVKLAEGVVKLDGIRPVPGKPYEWYVSFFGDQSSSMRRIFHRMGHVVKRFECVCFAGITVDGLERGQWRALRPEEVARFKLLMSSEK